MISNFVFDLTFFWQNMFCWNFEDHQNPLWNAQIRGFRSIEQIWGGDVHLEPYQLVSMLVKNGNLRRNSYWIWIEFGRIFGCKASEMLLFIFGMVWEHTTIHFRWVTSVLTPKFRNRLFLKKLDPEDPFKGILRI